MSSSKVIYVNDDDMLGGMFNNETKPVNTPEHAQMMTPTVSNEQTGGGESTMKPLTPMEVPQLAPLQPVTIQHTAMVQQQQPATVQQNTLEAMPVMTGGKKRNDNGDGNAVNDGNAANDGNDNELNGSESESETDESDTEEQSQKQPSQQQGPSTVKKDDDDDDSCSDTSSICTEQLLTFDPMYIKLTKFLYTSEPDGKYGRNITQVLEGIEKQMERLANALQKSTLMSMSSTETTQEE